jgi:hypothetical protein
MSKNKKAFIQTKKYPDSFSDDVTDILKILTIPDTFKVALLGSSALKIVFPSDYDSYSQVNVTNRTTEDFKQVIKKLLLYKSEEFEKMRRTEKGVYIGDIKIGIIPEFRIVAEDIKTSEWESQIPDMLQKAKSLKDKKIIDDKEYKLCLDLIKPKITYADMLIAQSELNFQNVRWKPHDVLKGFVVYRTVKVMLDDALYQKARVKIDVIGWVAGQRYCELSMVYKFYRDGVIIYDENKTLMAVLKQQVLTNGYNKNYMKMAKRMLSIERFRDNPNINIINKLFSLFNSDLGRLSQIISDIQNYIYMIEHFNKLTKSPLPLYRLRFESNQFKSRLSQIVNPLYLRHEKEINVLISDLQNEPQSIKILSKLEEMFNSIVQIETLKYLKTNKLYPVQPQFLPKEEPTITPRTKNSPENLGLSVSNAVVSTIEGEGKSYCMPVKELVTEHKRIVGELKTIPSLKKEYTIQKTELDKYKKMEGDGKMKTPFKTASKKAGLSMHDYAVENQHDKGITGKRSRYFLNVIENHLLEMKGKKKLEGGAICSDVLKEMFEAAFKPVPQIKQYKLVKGLSNNLATVYVAKNIKSVVMSVKGTEGVFDWINNFIFAAKGVDFYKVLPRYTRVKKILEKIVKQYEGYYISLIGYSQGGIAASELGRDKRVWEVINLNPASMPGYNSEKQECEYTIRGTTDYVSHLNLEEVKSKRNLNIKTTGLSPLEAHKIDIMDKIKKIMIGRKFK